MSTVSNIRICPHCKSDITTRYEPSDMSSCPVCGKTLKMPQTNYFGLPDYLRLQMDSLLKEGGPYKLKVNDDRYNGFVASLEQELTNIARECTDEDRIGALSDAHKMLSEVMHSNASKEVIRYMVDMGKAMGRLAEAIEQYFKAGGQINDRKTGYLLSPYGDAAWNQAAASAGRDEPG